jgi:Uma2 family endonuclease
MNAPAVKRMTVPEFLAWAETQDSGRYELVSGQIVAMAPERWEHVQAKQRAFRALEVAIEHAGVSCQALVDGLAVAVDEETSYIPDTLVNCGEPGAPHAMIAPCPVIVVEVLSPSTRGIDTTVKQALPRCRSRATACRPLPQAAGWNRDSGRDNRGRDRIRSAGYLGLGGEFSRLIEPAAVASRV